MTEFFLSTLNRSISACYLVAAVLIARLLLRKAPKWASVALWGLVALRLICPFSLESVLSLVPSAQTVQPEILMDSTPEITSGIQAVDEAVNPVIQETFTPSVEASANPLQIVVPILAAAWCVGMAAMGIYGLVSYLHLRRRVAEAVRIRGNLYQCGGISAPFVLGLIRPRIYLPYSLEDPERKYVIAHERAHIQRRDPWWKAAGYLLLSVHWFNPLLWLAYILLCRDIELACDERVIRSLGAECRADYSQALLNCSIGRRHIAACPLAFGEVGVKQRVKSALSYRKPTFWAILAAALAIVLLAVGFLTDPVSESSPIAKIIYQDGYRITKVQNSNSISFGVAQLTLEEATRSGDTYEFEDRSKLLTHLDGCSIYLKALTITEEDTSAVYQLVYDEELSDYGQVIFPYQVFQSGQEISYFYREDTAEFISYTDSELQSALKTGGTLEITVSLLSQDGIEANSQIAAAVDMDELDQITFPPLFYSKVSYVSTENPLEIGGQSFAFQELLYDSPQFDSSIPIETGEVLCSVSESGELKMQTIFSDDDSLDSFGTLSELTLTEENFDSAFQNFDATAIRKNTVKAWRKGIYSTEANVDQRTVAYLLLEENGDVYLAYGYTDLQYDNPVFRWLIRLGTSGEAAETTAAEDGAAEATVFQGKISGLNADACGYTAEFLTEGGGYISRDADAAALAKLLEALPEEEFAAAGTLSAEVSITLSDGSTDIEILSDWEKALITVSGEQWEVSDPALQAWLAELRTHTPSQSTYEIYNEMTLEEIPSGYTMEEAEIDQCVVLNEGQVIGNLDIWLDFAQKVSAYETASVRLYISYGGSVRICDLHYNGQTFTLRWLEDGESVEKTYLELTAVASDADALTYTHTYILANGGIRYSQDSNSLLDPAGWTDEQAVIVCYSQVTKSSFSVPGAITSAQLVSGGEVQLEIADSETLTALLALLSQAEGLGYAPKTFSSSADLILTYADGSTSALQLSEDSDLFLNDSDGEYYDYGPGTGEEGNRNALPELLEILGLTGWPNA